MITSLSGVGKGPHDAVLNHALSVLKSNGGGTLNLSGSFFLVTTITIPDKIILKGDGAATLSWQKDLGTGVPAIQSDPNTVGQIAAARFENIQLNGPGFRSNTTPVGTQLAQMDGFAPGGCSDLYNCSAEGFRAGVAIRSDHNTFTRCKFSNNYYNVYFADKPKGLGNHQFIGCWLDGPLFASVAVAGDNILGSCNFIGGHLGFGPYGFYKFDGPSGPSTQGFMHDVHLDGISFEATGNGPILDESTGTTNGQDSLFAVNIDQCGFMWNDDVKIASRPRDWAVDVRFVKFSKYCGGSYPFIAGAKGTFNFKYGDIDIDLGQTDPSYNNVFGNDFNGAIASSTVRSCNKWSAEVYQNTNGQPIKRGMAIELGGGWFQANPLGLQSKLFYGIAMHDAPVGAPVIVANRGTVQALCKKIPWCGTPLAPASDGSMLCPTTSDDPKVVAVSIGNGGSDTGDLVTISLI